MMKKQKKILFILAGTLLALTVLIAHRPGQGGTTTRPCGTIVYLP